MAEVDKVLKRVVIGEYLLELYESGDLHIEDGGLLDGAGYPTVFCFTEDEVKELRSLLNE